MIARVILILAPSFGAYLVRACRLGAPFEDELNVARDSSGSGSRECVSAREWAESVLDHDTPSVAGEYQGPILDYGFDNLSGVVPHRDSYLQAFGVDRKLDRSAPVGRMLPAALVLLDFGDADADVDDEHE